MAPDLRVCHPVQDSQPQIWTRHGIKAEPKHAKAAAAALDVDPSQHNISCKLTSNSQNVSRNVLLHSPLFVQASVAVPTVLASGCMAIAHLSAAEV